MRKRAVVDRGSEFPLPSGVRGHADPKFASVTNAFARLFARGRGGGALAVYVDGEPVVDIWAGTSDRAGKTLWDSNTAAMPYSASKGIASTVIHRLADRGLIDYDAPVAEYWQDFGANGKSKITVRQLMTHSAGLSELAHLAKNADELLDHRLMEERLAAAKPGVLLGRPAYHSLTYGWLMAGLARSVTDKGMAELFRTEIAQPLGVEGIYLGTPPVGAPTVASGFNGSMGAMNSRAGKRIVPRTLRTPGPLGAFMRTAFVPGFESLLDVDHPRILDTEMPAANAMVTASALGAIYSAIACDGQSPNGRFLSAERVRQLAHVQTRQLDRTLYIPFAWRLGYHSIPVPGAQRGFGHVGLVGSMGWADRNSRMAIGFVHNRLPDLRYLAYDQMMGFRLAPIAIRAARAARVPGTVVPFRPQRTA
jgi:CubicO group peptidase (beta-lactamase class C family)